MKRIIKPLLAVLIGLLVVHCSEDVNTPQVEETDVPEMVFVEGGTFTIGCEEDEADCDSNERPAHDVTVNDFYIGKYEVTQSEYMALMVSNPSNITGNGNLPVENISRLEIAEYCNLLSEAERLEPCYTINGNSITCDFTKEGYRLPTEAEWEYAARGGNQSQGYMYAGSNNIEAVAWYSGNATSTTHEVGTKNPNELGLYDMSGNAWEQCWDWYDSSYPSGGAVTNPTGPAVGSDPVIRGGSYHNSAWDSRVSRRTFHNPPPDFSDYNGPGFRLARTADGAGWGDTNQPPAIPNSPVPGDAAVDVSLTPTLEWQSSDPDGDALTYDIYFGDTETPPLVESDYNAAAFTPDTLVIGKTYYWKVVAKDGDEGLTQGPVWSFTTERGEFIPAEMVRVEGGTFTMGCTAEQGDDCEFDEVEPHEVTVSSFYIGKYEVTQAEYVSLMGTNPSQITGSTALPVENLTWYDVLAYCNALSTAEGLEPCYVIDGNNTTCDFTKNGYRLPTEAEWEFAARGGTRSLGFKYSGSNNPDEVAWYLDNSSESTHDSGSKASNELVIYDMSGNVWEWCWDRYGEYTSESQTDPTGPDSGDTRVLRGGSYLNSAQYCRVAERNAFVPLYGFSNLGFRLARTE